MLASQHKNTGSQAVMCWPFLGASPLQRANYDYTLPLQDLIFLHFKIISKLMLPLVTVKPPLNFVLIMLRHSITQAVFCEIKVSLRPVLNIIKNPLNLSQIMLKYIIVQVVYFQSQENFRNRKRLNLGKTNSTFASSATKYKLNHQVRKKNFTLN